MLGLAEPLQRALKETGYATPTPIQARAIPSVLEGRDLLGIAQTGTGKTAAFALPLLQRLMNEKIGPAARSPRVLVLAPTRELAAQIADSARVYSRFMKMSVGVVVGGVRPGPQVAMLARGTDFLVATPGRLLDHLSTGAVRLDRVRAVVLDEADHMLDLGFIPAIRRIFKALPAQRQTLLFSATMPDAIAGLANDMLRDPVKVAVAPVATTVERVEQSVYLVEKRAKRDLLVDLLGRPEFARALVFTRTKRGADRVREGLDAAGIAAEAIHGNKSQGQRQRALDAFKAGDSRILVATDIAARGIDVEGVSHVVNFELPDVPETYVHRIGRTARAGAAGIAISLCDEEEAHLLRDIERTTRNVIPKIDRRGAVAARPAAARPKPATGRPVPARPTAGGRPTGEVKRTAGAGAPAPSGQGPRRRRRRAAA